MHSTFWRVTVVLLCSCTFAAPQVKQATYPDTSDGLQFQAQTVLNAYLSGDQREFEASTRLFALPDPETWLGHTFGPEHAADLAADYRKYFKSFQSALARQLERWRETDEFVPWPPCATTSREFVQLWREAFRPLREWVNVCALCVAAEVQRDYREFRLERGMLTYDDQVALALELIRHPEAARQIRENNFRVLLDEAQDTDPRQFSLLLDQASK